MRLVQLKKDKKYWEFVRQLRNDPIVKKGFIQQEEISKEEHYHYMQENYKNFFICLKDEVPVGYIGVVYNDIRVATSPEYQKKGVAKFMVDEIVKKFPSAVAKVKLRNKASLKLFESCGFKKKYYILEKNSDD